MQIRVDSWCAGCQCKTAALLSILSQQLPHCNNTPAPEPMGPAAGDRAAYPCPQLIYGTRVISLQKNFFFFSLIQINKSKVLPPSFPPPPCSEKGRAGGCSPGKRGKRASGREDERREKRDFCSLLRLVMELIKQALQSFNSTKPAGDNGMRGEGGGKKKKERISADNQIASKLERMELGARQREAICNWQFHSLTAKHSFCMHT